MLEYKNNKTGSLWRMPGEIHLEMPSSYPKDGSCAIYNDEIETILTKQQYTQNCYKIDTN